MHKGHIENTCILHFLVCYFRTKVVSFSPEFGKARGGTRACYRIGSLAILWKYKNPLWFFTWVHNKKNRCFVTSSHSILYGSSRLIGHQAKKLIFYIHSRPSKRMFTLYVFVNVSNARFPSSGNFGWKSGLGFFCCSFPIPSFH